MSPQKDYYEILGVGREASDKEIKSAYRKECHQCHPDKHPNDPTAEERFKELQEAYSVLGDAEKRRVYDTYGVDGLQRGFNPGRSNGFWDDFSNRWRETYQRRSAKGIVLSGINPDSEMFRRVNDLKQRLQTTLRYKNFFGLQEIVRDLMDIYHARWEVGGRDFSDDPFSLSFSFSRREGYRQGLSDILRDIPQDCYHLIFGEYNSRGEFLGGIEVLEEILEYRLSPQELRSLEETCQTLGKNPQEMKKSLAKSALDLYLDHLLQKETTGNTGYAEFKWSGFSFKGWNWRKNSREFVERRMEHYRTFRDNLQNILKVDVREAERAVAEMYFSFLFGSERDNLFYFHREGAAWYEDGYMISLALPLMSHQPSEEGIVPFGLNNSNLPTSNNLLSQMLVRSRGGFITKVHSKRPNPISINYREQKEDLKSLVDVVRKMAEVAGTEEAREVARKVKEESGLSLLRDFINFFSPPERKYPY